MITIPETTLAALLRALLKSGGAEFTKALTHRMHPWWAQQLVAQLERGKNISSDFLEQQFWSDQLPMNLLPLSLRDKGGEFLVVGRAERTGPAVDALVKGGLKAAALAWTFDNPAPIEAPTGAKVIFCESPLGPRQWETVRSLRQKLGERFLPLWTLLLPYSVMEWARESQTYHLTSDQLATTYAAKYRGEFMDKLNELCPLEGKRVIEFGTFEGSQTSGLASFRPRELITIEIRPENMIKSLVASQIAGWKNVRIVMDNFHNVAGDNYGRFDLAYAHGVYYHSDSTFLFLENLCSLSDNVFIGGFCATEALPAGPWTMLSYKDRPYKAKSMPEGNDYTAGVQPTSYVFERASLMEWFEKQGYSVRTVQLQEVKGNLAGGEFFHMLATKK